MYFTVNKNEGSVGIDNHVCTILAYNTDELKVALFKGLSEHFDAAITLPEIDIDSMLYGRELEINIVAAKDEDSITYPIIINETWMY